jgi:hypothetical protein
MRTLSQTTTTGIRISNSNVRPQAIRRLQDLPFFADTRTPGMSIPASIWTYVQHLPSAGSNLIQTRL